MNAYRAEDNVQLPDIINRPDLQSRWQRGWFAALAAAGWLIWLYLFAPILSLLGWLFGAQRFSQYVLFTQEHTVRTVLIYALIILVAGVFFLGWAIYNYLRFRGEDRREPPVAVTNAQMAEAFRIDVGAVATVQRLKVARLGYDELGHIVTIQPDDAAAGRYTRR